VQIGFPALRVAPDLIEPRETLIIGHPGQNQHGIRKLRFPDAFIFSRLQRPKMAAHPCAAGNANNFGVALGIPTEIDLPGPGWMTTANDACGNERGRSSPLRLCT